MRGILLAVTVLCFCGIALANRAPGPRSPVLWDDGHTTWPSTQPTTMPQPKAEQRVSLPFALAGVAASGLILASGLFIARRQRQL